ncbi:hypothetical protein BKA81DRAFT_421032, partial [Phyllosticta paracitricarpa]
MPVQRTRCHNGASIAARSELSRQVHAERHLHLRKDALHLCYTDVWSIAQHSISGAMDNTASIHFGSNLDIGCIRSHRKPHRDMPPAHENRPFLPQFFPSTSLRRVFPWTSTTPLRLRRSSPHLFSTAMSSPRRRTAIVRAAVWTQPCPALFSPGQRPDSLQPHGRPVVRNSAARTQSKTRTAYVAYSTRALSHARCGRQLAHLPLIPICPDRRLRTDCLASHPLSIYIRPASVWLFFSLFASRDQQFSLTLQLRLVPSPPLCDLCFQIPPPHHLPTCPDAAVHTAPSHRRYMPHLYS